VVGKCEPFVEPDTSSIRTEAALYRSCGSGGRGLAPVHMFNERLKKGSIRPGPAVFRTSGLYGCRCRFASGWSRILIRVPEPRAVQIRLRRAPNLSWIDEEVG